MDAHGTIDSFLGRLSTVLVNEAQLLGGVRKDVEFIKDEMESMNSLILVLTEAQHRNHQVRAWMKQVIGLSRDCDGNVELYVHYVGRGPYCKGIFGYLWRIPWFLKTIPVRHRIAARIRELKVRARDVGDRRQRYGVTVPQSSTANMHNGDVKLTGEDQDLQRRTILFEAEPPGDDRVVVKKAMGALIKCLSAEPATTEDGELQQVRFFSILGVRLALKAAEGAYQHPSLTTVFGGCKVWLSSNRVITPEDLTAMIVEEMSGVQIRKSSRHYYDTAISKLTNLLNGKRFLIVITEPFDDYFSTWESALDPILQAAEGCQSGSAIVVTTNSDHVGLLSSTPYKVIKARSLPEFYANKAKQLNVHYGNDHPHEVYKFYEYLRCSSAVARKMFLHLMFVNPNTTTDFHNGINKTMQLKKSIARQMVLFCYNELPTKYRSCLLYLAVFPRGHVIKTRSLARRWIVEGFVSTKSIDDETDSVADEAKPCWDLLFARGFISPVEISAEGNIKTCKLEHEVHQVITKIARDVNIVDMNLPTHLAHHLSVHNRIGLPNSHSGGESKDIAASISSLAASPQWKLLKVLDLEGCHGLEKHHLKSICKILLLKYLSLRNTNIAELPRQIKELQCLETLDIRQTKVQVLAKKAILLPLLKYFLAGNKGSAIKDSTTPEDSSFFAVKMPLCVEKMKDIEILSHVQVSNGIELARIVGLLKLRKLGVELDGKNVKLSDLFSEIEKLSARLRSLSIWMDRPFGSENLGAGEVESLPSLPDFIKSLNISGVSNGLPRLIQDRHQLAKVTLSEVYLKEDGIRILGALHGLRYLRLQHKSYTKSELSFMADEFLCLSYLLVEGNDITKISFGAGAALKLERIVWYFDTMQALSGVRHLHELKKVELNGDCNLDRIEEELEEHPNHPELRHKPHH